MNDLQIFENPEFGQVRTVEIDGTPWPVSYTHLDVYKRQGCNPPARRA